MNRFPPRKILVPYDCTPRARLAWRHARLLARRFGSALEAVYVAPFYVGPEVVVIQPMDAAERLHLQGSIAERLPEASAVHIRQGDVVVGILDALKRSGADLIVTTTAGLRGLRRLERESVTESLVRRSPVPVLCARGEPRLPRSVLAPLNLERYSLAGLWLAAEAARACGARLSALHVAPNGSEDELEVLRLRDRAARLGARLELAHGKPIPVILDAARRHDLVALVVHRKGLLHDALLGTTAEQILRRSQTSVLTVPPPAPVVRGQPGNLRRARANRWARPGRARGVRAAHQRQVRERNL